MQFCQPFSFRDLQVDMQNFVNSNYRVEQNNRNFDGRKQRHFLGDGDALVYLAGPIRNKYFTTIVSGYPFITYVSYDRFFSPPSPLYAYVHI